MRDRRSLSLALSLMLCACPDGGGPQVDGATVGGDGGLAACTPACGDRQICAAGVCQDLPAHCPCPAGSYCDIASDSCRPGCLTDDQCGPSERCDPGPRQCRCREPLNRCGAACVPDSIAACGATCAVCPASPLHGVSSCSNGACGFTCDMHYRKDGATCAPVALTCYQDGDGDGYGEAARTQVVMGQPCPAGWSAKQGDCDDGNADVHPDQKKYFSTSYGARKSYDYDCDGKETMAPLFNAGQGPAACQSNPPPNAKLNTFCYHLDYPDCDCSAQHQGAGDPSCGERASGSRCRWPGGTSQCTSAEVVSYTVACR